MAGKTGLNISHAEPLPQFIERYDHTEWLKPWVENGMQSDSELDERIGNRLVCG